MKLRKLKLTNFRQHADTTIEFRDGLTGIIGPNGAGKSTILEAIAWAIYGAPAARGTNDTIRFARAPGRSSVIVELDLELSGHEFRVFRTLNNASVFLDGSPTPVASGIGTVTQYLETRLGMTREEFFNTYFTGQKEVQFLAQLGPSQRARFLGQVLGYERLRVAQNAVRNRRRELHSEIEGIRVTLPDLHALRIDRERAEARVSAATSELKVADKALASAVKQLDRIRPKWEASQQKREQSKESLHLLTAAQSELQTTLRDIDRLRQDLAAIATANEQLLAVRQKLNGLADLEQRCSAMAELARIAERRRALEESLRTARIEHAERAERLKALEQAPALLKQYQSEIEQARNQFAEAERHATAAREGWVGERQDVATKLQQHLQLFDELKEKIRQLAEAGPDGTCPTCTRPLGQEYERVFALLEDEFEDVKQNGKWLRRRETQLEKIPEDVAAAEERRTTAHKALETVAQRMAKCEQAVQELWTLTAETKKRESRNIEIEQELQQLPAGYDRELHKKLDRELADLREVARLASRLEHAVENRTTRDAEMAAAQKHQSATEKRIAKLQQDITRLAFDEEAHATLRSEFDRVSQDQRKSELAATQLRGKLENAKEQLVLIRQAETNAEEGRARLAEVELDLRHHNELDAAFTELRTELNARVRPELGELASVFLNEITDGRYTSLEIDDNYNVIVLDEGEEKPVISGGEEDVANLVLRIAISQMIAERAGQQLSTLFLDEVFASLDIERRDNVVQLLHRLEDRFEQVILITHVETIREGLDHTIRVSFDERSGSSVVREDRGPISDDSLYFSALVS